MKEKISQEKGWEASQQKLIYSGMCETGTSFPVARTLYVQGVAHYELRQ